MADVEASHSEWDDALSSWSAFGSGYKPTDNPSPDWLATIRLLIEAGVSVDGITFNPDDPEPPRTDLADLLRLCGFVMRELRLDRMVRRGQAGPLE